MRPLSPPPPTPTSSPGHLVPCRDSSSASSTYPTGNTSSAGSEMIAPVAPVRPGPPCYLTPAIAVLRYCAAMRTGVFTAPYPS